jgi:hypothetical protein
MARTNTLDRIIAAATRLKALRTEVSKIEAQFPGLAGLEARRAARAPKAAASKRRRRKPMTAAQKKAVGNRMRKYWAARRKVDSKG